ncbi:hypothetical protein [Aureispira sp. CCB-E]|uniref:hypothetical protein n=1 Tax=Aureispira sp. CCB-E TaxID=3051121 RepID=UPI002868C1B6|nr:hypothetical protein [Aureispira sp. CCB-E]WMX16573.1 hypothetical protein QP953_09355 [Aureispira sp. CCB-E]
MKAQPEKYNIIILTLTLNMNIVIGDDNTLINHSELSDSNNIEQVPTREQDSKQIITMLQQELAQLRQIIICKDQALLEKDKLIQLLILREQKE